MQVPRGKFFTDVSMSDPSLLQCDEVLDLLCCEYILLNHDRM